MKRRKTEFLMSRNLLPWRSLLKRCVLRQIPDLWWPSWICNDVAPGRDWDELHIEARAGTFGKTESYANLNSEHFLCPQIEYTIHRDNKGLGINIAGGKGSTPFKGEDEVYCCVFSEVFFWKIEKLHGVSNYRWPLWAQRSSRDHRDSCLVFQPNFQCFQFWVVKETKAVKLCLLFTLSILK